MYAVGISVSRAPPWFSILAPKGTPAPIIEKLNRAVN
jgi:tripartite-type tricarboxylate transporter receptor subunit TctC